MKTKSPYSSGIIVVFSVVAIAATAATLSTIDTTLNAYAQNTTTPTNQTADPQQIKNYLNQAIQALDSGNNTRAFEQVELELAEGQLESMIGIEDAEEDDEDEDEEGGIDTDDEEDTP